MRYASVLAITLIFAASALAQQTPASSQTPAQDAPSAHADASTADQPPAHPITPAQVHEVLELTGANHLAVQVMRGMMVNLRKSFPPYVPKDVIDDLEASMEKMDFESMAVEAYQKHISTEDAAKAITFYKTPAGRRIIGVMPQVVGEMQANGAKAGMQISQQVIARHMDEIKAAAEKYQQEHSAPPTVTSPN